MNDGTVIAGMRSEPTGVDTAKVSTNNRSLSATLDAVHAPELSRMLDGAMSNLMVLHHQFAGQLMRIQSLVDRIKAAQGEARGDYQTISNALETGSSPAPTTEGDGQ